MAVPLPAGVVEQMGIKRSTDKVESLCGGQRNFGLCICQSYYQQHCIIMVILSSQCDVVRVAVSVTCVHTD